MPGVPGDYAVCACDVDGIELEILHVLGLAWSSSYETWAGGPSTFISAIACTHAARLS